MLKRWMIALPLKRAQRADAAGQEGESVDLGELSEELFEIAGELDIVATASQIVDFSDSEGYGLYLILRRQIDRIKAVNDRLCAQP